MYHFGSYTKSSVFPKTLNPSWNEKSVLDSYIVNNSIPPLVLTIWDKDINFIGTESH